MPYAMLADAIPAARMGFYMGVFNFFIVLPQILAATVLGPVVQYFFGGHALPAVMAARALGPDEPATLVGRSCENDEMGDYVLPRDLAAGDLLALRITGAYTYSMASNYNRFGRPPVVFVRDGHHRRVVRGESADDVVRLDLV